MDFTCVIPPRMPGTGRKQDHRPPLAELDANVRRSQAAAFAEGTLKNLIGQWVKYLTFCLFYGFQALPASIDTLCRYAQYLSANLKAHGSLLCYLSGVKTLHRLMRYPVDQFHDLLVKLTLKGIHRNNPYIPKEAPPMTLEILSEIYNKLDMSIEDDVIFWAVTLVGFFLLLRKCNLVPDSVNKFDSAHQLSRKDLQIEVDHIKVTLHWTKNSQCGNKPLRFALPRIPGSPLCPVEAVLAVLLLVEGSPLDSLFKRSDGTCYTYQNLQNRLAQLSTQLGLSEKLTSHSLRSGGATNAFLSGVPAEIIKILGHWKSDCYLKYIRLPEQARMAAGVLVKYQVLSLDL